MNDTKETETASRYLLDLYSTKHVNHKGGLAEIIAGLDIGALVAGYHDLRAAAPARHSRNKAYLVDNHDGVPSTGASTNRREEHLALALWNDQRDGLLLPDGEALSLIDYQVPLKARRSDAGVGKLDLLGVLANSLCVVELKVAPNSGSGDTPLRAFLEALAYCAIVEANMADIIGELEGKHSVAAILEKPCLVVIAPDDYWAGWCEGRATGRWWAALRQLASQVATELGVVCHFLALQGAEFQVGLNGNKPRLLSQCDVTEIDALVAANG
jgi:hypothetical protein